MRVRYEHPDGQMARGRRYAGAWVCDAVRCCPRRHPQPLPRANPQAALAEVDRRCLARYGRSASAVGLTARMLASILASSPNPMTAGQLAARLGPVLRAR